MVKDVVTQKVIEGKEALDNIVIIADSAAGGTN